MLRLSAAPSFGHELSTVGYASGSFKIPTLKPPMDNSTLASLALDSRPNGTRIYSSAWNQPLRGCFFIEQY